MLIVFRFYGTVVIDIMISIAATVFLCSVQATTVSITVDDTAKGVHVPPTVIGVELEGVGHSIYGGGLYSQLVFDESFEDPHDSPTATPTPPPPPVVVIESVAAPGRSIRHCEAQLYATKMDPPPLSRDHSFTVVAGLGRGEGTVSFQSINYPTYYIAPIYGAGKGGGAGRLGVVDRATNSSVAFATSASFTVVPLAPPSPSGSALIKAVDGRVVALTPASLSGGCAGLYAAPDANVALVQMADLSALADASWNITAHGGGAPQQAQVHWTYLLGDTGAAKMSTVTPFHGLLSLNLSCKSASGNDKGAQRGGNSGRTRAGAGAGADAGAGAGAGADAGAGDASGLGCAAATNKNVYRRGIAARRGMPYEGYLFLRNLGAAASGGPLTAGGGARVTVGLYTMDGGHAGAPEHGGGGRAAATATGAAAENVNGRSGWVAPPPVPLATVAFQVVSAEWTMFNFTLTPQATDNASAFVIGLQSPGTAVGVDMVFLEPGLWGRYAGMHLRKDVVRGLLLDGQLRSIRFDGTSVVANPKYLWRDARGPAWQRPPRYGDYWYGYITNGFGMFEVLQIAEEAKLGSVTVGINIRAETPATAADLMEYVFANTSTAMGALRAADGHPEPYPPTLVVELGNEERGSDYAARAVPIAAAMRQRLQLVAPAAASQVQFALAFNDWQKEWPLAAQMVNATGGHPELLTWDQHDLGMMASVAQAMDDHDQMLSFLRSHGWTSATPLFIGETNCATSRGVCVGMERALTYGLYTNAAARRGFIGTVSPAVWAYSTCDPTGEIICGANDGTATWPQASMVVTPTTVVPQPSWYAHALIGAAWGDVSLPVTPNSTRCAQLVEEGSGDAGGVVDVAAFRNSSDGSATAHVVKLHVVSLCSGAITIDAVVKGATPCGGGGGNGGGVAAPTTVLAASSMTDVNTVADPNNVHPTATTTTKVDPSTGTVSIVVPPKALAIVTVCIRPPAP
jgi:hypothetical protein